MKPKAEPGAACPRPLDRANDVNTEIAVRILAPAWRRMRPLAVGRAGSAARAALHAAEAWLTVGRGAQIELAIVLADDAVVRRLNLAYRGIDKATNVLSFGNGGHERRRAQDEPVMLGDVVLAYETIAAEASAQGKFIADHASHLVVHGVLHLLGHDHRTSSDADAMEAIETDVLAGLGIADPYRPRAVPGCREPEPRG